MPTTSCLENCTRAAELQSDQQVDMPSIQELGERIAANSAVVNKWLASMKCQRPSFDQDADQEFPSTVGMPEIETARLAIIDDTSALHDLIIGPGEVLRRLCWGVGTLHNHLQQYSILTNGPVR